MGICPLAIATTAGITRFQTDILIFGNKGNGNVNKKLIFETGQGVANPLFQWNALTNMLQFANDGVTFNNMGAAMSGASAGIVNESAGSSTGQTCEINASDRTHFDIQVYQFPTATGSVISTNVSHSIGPTPDSIL